MPKTNDPQMFSSGYDRNNLDRYWTHPWMVDELFKHCAGYIPKTVWECSAGRGDMTRAILNHDRIVYSTDIDMSEFDYSIGIGHEKSFLDEFEVPICYENGDLEDVEQRGPCRAIITNPPYNEPWKGIGDDFIRHGLTFFDQGIEFMAMLMRAEFNAGKTRADMFGDCSHFMGELVLTTRPRWDYSDPDRPQSASPRHNFSWFLWNRNWNKTYEYPVQIYSYLPRGFQV